MKSRIDPDIIAKTGTREERSGKFIAPKARPPRPAVEQSIQRGVNHL